MSRYIHQLMNFKNQGLKWSFYLGYMICLTLILVVEGEQFYSPWWFSFNNSNGKSCNPGILQRSIWQHFIRDVRAKFGIPNSPQSPDIRQNSDGGISEFRISRQSLIKGNCHNSRASDDIDMKLGTVTKIDKRNKTTLKKLTMTSFWKTVTSLPYFQFTANLEQSGGRITDAQFVKGVCSLIVTFYPTKTANRTKKSLIQLSHYCFEYSYYFGQNILIFLQTQ